MPPGQPSTIVSEDLTRERGSARAAEDEGDLDRLAAPILGDVEHLAGSRLFDGGSATGTARERCRLDVAELPCGRKRAVRGRIRATSGRRWLTPLPFGPEAKDLRPDHRVVASSLPQDLGTDALSLATERKQDVLGSDQIVSERPRFLVRHLENLLRPWRKRDVTRDRSTRRLHNLSDFVSQLKKREIQSTQGTSCDACLLAKASQEKVLGPDGVVSEKPRLFLRAHHQPARVVAESL